MNATMKPPAVETGPLTDDEVKEIHTLAWFYNRDAMFVADATTGRVVDVNPAACSLMGFERADIIGMHQRNLHPESEHRLADKAFREAMQNPDQYQGFHLLTADGREIPVEINTTDEFVSRGKHLVVGIFRDITGKVEKQRRLRAQNWALHAYSHSVAALNSASSSDRMMKAVCDAITKDNLYVLAFIGLAGDDPDKQVRIATASGAGTAYLDGLVIRWGEQSLSGRGPTGRAIRTGETCVLRDTLASPEFVPWRERAAAYGIRSSVSVPFALADGSRAVLVVYADVPDAFEPEAVQTFRDLTQQLAAGIAMLHQRAQLEQQRAANEGANRRIHDALEGTIVSIVATVERRDPYTAGHNRRVAEIACAIGRKLGLDSNAMEGLRFAALVHDVGKIAVPAEILTKPGRLSPNEFALVKEHPETGYEILKDIQFPWPVAQIVRQHHEKIDGSGYPLGLTGDQILPESKIVAVADIFEAVASPRPYRAGLGVDATIALIEKEAGKTLDPDVVKACVALFREDGFQLPMPQVY